MQTLIRVNVGNLTRTSATLTSFSFFFFFQCLGGGVGGGGGLREKQHFKMEGREKWKKNLCKANILQQQKCKEAESKCGMCRCTIPSLLPLKFAFDFQALKVCNIFFLEIS